MRTKTDEKRREILEAAAVEFRERGFHGTTLSHVAARMNSSKATIYNYFTSKGELFGSMLAAAAKPTTDSLLQGFQQLLPLAERLSVFVRAYVKMQSREDSIAIQRLLIAEHANQAVIQPLHAETPLNIWSPLADIFREEQRLGSLTDGDPDEMVTQLRALMHGDLPLRMLFGDHVSFTKAQQEASADSAVRIFLLAYGAK